MKQSQPQTKAPRAPLGRSTVGPQTSLGLVLLLAACGNSPGPGAGDRLPTGSGGATATDGAVAGSGAGSGAALSTGGATSGTGGELAGGSGSGASHSGGQTTGGSDAAGEATGGASASAGSGGASNGTGGAAAGGAEANGGTFTGTCTESTTTGPNASGSGPHDVVVETNSDSAIKEGTIFRPADMGGDEKYPIFVWGQGGCSQNGLANAAAMAEIASHGYFVVADGTPNGTDNRVMDRSMLDAMGAPLIAYVDWAIAENAKPCSAYFNSLDTQMVASNGFSCGGMMAQGTVTDPRIVTWGVTSSGMAGATQAFYDLIDTPVLFVEGGPEEVAYDGGLLGYDTISQLGVPVLWFSKDLGHGGDLFQPNGGDFTKINLAWLNWWLKGDETVTGKGLLVGPDCPYCGDSDWVVKSANVP